VTRPVLSCCLSTSDTTYCANAAVAISSPKYHRKTIISTLSNLLKDYTRAINQQQTLAQDQESSRGIEFAPAYYPDLQVYLKTGNNEQLSYDPDVLVKVEMDPPNAQGRKVSYDATILMARFVNNWSAVSARGRA
jgi:hypothetical protein